MDWEQFFLDNRIDYVTRGPNVKKGNVYIHCPLCGDDPSYHMGVSLSGEEWGCWRAANHAGKKAHNLIRVLLGCSFNQAKLIVKQYSSSDPENLDDALKALTDYDKPDKSPPKSSGLSFRPEFQKIKPTGTTSRFFNYIKKRGFKDTEKFIKRYRLRACTTGPWKDRIIIPIYRNKKLISWTSRALTKTINAPRYKALSEDQGGLVNVFHSLWNWDALIEGGELLFIVEGPFDALKLDYYGFDSFDAHATCTFGTNMSEEQAYLIAEICVNFNKAILLYDEGATEAIFNARSLLEHTSVEIGFLPQGIEDPGEMTRKQVREFIRSYS